MSDNHKLSFNAFKELAQKHTRVTVHQTLLDLKLTPEEAFLALKPHVCDAALLNFNSNLTHVTFDPLITIKAYQAKCIIEHATDAVTIDQDPFDTLRTYLAKHSCKTTHAACGYLGGMVGFMSYDAIRLIEPHLEAHASIDDIPDILFRAYQSNLAFDKTSGEVTLSTVVSIAPDNLNGCYLDAYQQLDDLIQHLIAYQNTPSPTSHANTDTSHPHPHVDTDDATFCTRVEQVKRHIGEGELFQLVLSRRFSMPTRAKPFAVYQALTKANPAPYQFYFEFDDKAIAGTSPEKLISIQGGLIESKPLAGTRRRGAKPDHTLAEELQKDTKELAEHMMLVDLARNDVGRVAVPGSVSVTQLKKILTCKAVLHLASTVKGKLRDDCDVFDALKAAFPAGTLSGAPKIRAMELINTLESTKRGLYGGVLCAIDSQQNLDTAIIIRTALIQQNKAYVQTGAGIVHDSNPKAEAQETYHKAHAVLKGIANLGGHAA